MARQVPLGVLISGSGTNLQAIIDAIESGRLDAAIRVVVSNEPRAFGLERAGRHGVATEVVDHRRFPTREAFERKLIDVLNENQVELVILAGFMRLLSPIFVRSFANRIMNIHPALLPSFAGLHAQRQALDYGVRVSGCTVHFVNEECDGGPIIIQAVVPVFAEDTEESLSARILEQEHRVYPKAIQLYCEDRLRVVGRKVLVEGTRGGGEAEVMIQPPLKG
jgi:phosphoribosylglycinamide formyltransferase-1